MSRKFDQPMVLAIYIQHMYMRLSVKVHWPTQLKIVHPFQDYERSHSNNLISLTFDILIVDNRLFLSQVIYLQQDYLFKYRLQTVYSPAVPLQHNISFYALVFTRRMRLFRVKFFIFIILFDIVQCHVCIMVNQKSFVFFNCQKACSNNAQCEDHNNININSLS